MKLRPSILSLTVLAAVAIAAYPHGAAAAKMNKAPIAVTTGMFHSVAHDTKGSVTLYEFDGGSRELRIKGLDAAKGPDVHVYLVASQDAKDSMSVTKAGFIDLGKLKKTKGDSTYKVPASIDAWKYLAVSIWCKHFGVNFGTAPLHAAGK